MAAMTATAWHVPVPLAYCHQTNVSETSHWKNFDREVVNVRCFCPDAYNNDKLNHHNIHMYAYIHIR